MTKQDAQNEQKWAVIPFHSHKHNLYRTHNRTYDRPGQGCAEAQECLCRGYASKTAPAHPLASPSDVWWGLTDIIQGPPGLETSQLA